MDLETGVSSSEARLIDISELKALRNTEPIYPAIQRVQISSESFSFPKFCANSVDGSSHNWFLLLSWRAELLLEVVHSILYSQHYFRGRAREEKPKYCMLGEGWNDEKVIALRFGLVRRSSGKQLEKSPPTESFNLKKQN